MSNAPGGEPTAVLRAGRMSVSFARVADRYAHAIAWTDDEGNARPILESIEGDPELDWPPSPPFQELRVERVAAGEVLLLVGMAGKSHWSLSVEADRAASRLIFDFACRFRAAPGAIGNEYRACAPWEVASPTAKGEILLRHDSNIIRCTAESLDGDATSNIAANIAADGSQRLTITPSGEAPPPPATVRWRFSITVG